MCTVPALLFYAASENYYKGNIVSIAAEVVHALIGTVAMYFMLREKTSSRIRKTMLWPLACVVYLYLAAYTVTSWFAVIEGLGIELPPEEVGIPILLCIMLAVIAIVSYFTIYRPYRKMVKENKE